jgi:hypothetical protein
MEEEGNWVNLGFKNSSIWFFILLTSLSLLLEKITVVKKGVRWERKLKET